MGQAWDGPQIPSTWGMLAPPLLLPGYGAKETGCFLSLEPLGLSFPIREIGMTTQVEVGRCRLPFPDAHSWRGLGFLWLQSLLPCAWVKTLCEYLFGEWMDGWMMDGRIGWVGRCMES